MLKKSALVLLCLCLCLPLASNAAMRDIPEAMATEGTTLSEDKQRLAELQNKLNSIKGNLEKLRRDKEQSSAATQTIFETKMQLEQEYTYISEQNDTISAIIGSYEDIIKKAGREKEELEQDLEKQLRDFSTVLVELYKNRDLTKFDIFLRSDNYNSYTSYVEYMETVLKSSDSMVSKMKSTIEGIDKSKQEHEEAAAKLKEKKAELDKAKKKLEAKGRELDEKLGKEREKLELTEKEKEDMQKEQEQLRADVQELQKQIREKEIELAASYTGVFSWPLPSRTVYHISSRFGWRTDNPFKLGQPEFHNGIDIACARGTPIHAADGGVVTYAGYRGGFGNVLFVEHGGGLTTVYAHCDSLLVTAGTRVIKDQTIAKVGSTGKSSGNHLHFGVLKNGQYVDPEKYLPEYFTKGH